MTGPEAVGIFELAFRAAGTWRAPIRCVDITPAQFQRELAADDLDPWWCYAFSSMFASIREHRWEQVTDEVFQPTGRQPRTPSEMIAAGR